MAEPAEEQQEGELAPLGALTTEIVTAYVSKNAVAIADLGDLIETVGRTLVALGREEPSQTPPNRNPPSRCAARSRKIISSAWCAASGRRRFGAISRSRTS